VTSKPKTQLNSQKAKMACEHGGWHHSNIIAIDSWTLNDSSVHPYRVHLVFILYMWTSQILKRTEGELKLDFIWAWYILGELKWILWRWWTPITSLLIQTY
jgi:hypothetical protein